MISGILGAVGMLGKLGSKLIVDKDKQIEFAFKTQQLMFDLLGKLILAKTYPVVDALVKVMVTLVALARPIGTFYLTIRGIEMAAANSEVDIVSGGLMSMFPAWGAAREADKRRKHRRKIKQVDDEEDW